MLTKIIKSIYLKIRRFLLLFHQTLRRQFGSEVYKSDRRTYVIDSPFGFLNLYKGKQPDQQVIENKYDPGSLGLYLNLIQRAEYN